MRVFLNSIYLSIFTLLVVSVSNAQEAQPTDPDDQEKMYVEVNLPISRNGPFANALADTKTSSNGKVGFTLAWQPWTKATGDGKLKMIFRNVGFTANATLNNNNPSEIYDEYIGSVYELLSPLEVTRTCAGQYGGGKQCVTCGRTSLGVAQTCTVENIYGRYAPIKYSEGSAAIGMFVRKKWGKLITDFGANARLHATAEGTISNQLKKGWASTFAATVRVAYPMPFFKDFDAVGGYEEAFASVNTGKRWRWRQFTIGASKSW